MEIKVKSLGEDGFGRETYKNVDNDRVYAIVDGRYHTTSRDGEPECPLKDGVSVILDRANTDFSNNYTIGEFLVMYLNNQIIRVNSPEQADQFVKSAKFHGIKVFYVCKSGVRPHPTKPNETINPVVHMIVDRATAETLMFKEGFTCPVLEAKSN